MRVLWSNRDDFGETFQEMLAYSMDGGRKVIQQTKYDDLIDTNGGGRDTTTAALFAGLP